MEVAGPIGAIVAIVGVAVWCFMVGVRESKTR